MAAFSRLPFRAVLRTGPLLPAAYRLALEHGCTVYDAVFLAVSATARVELITADERLYRAVAGKLAGIQWLGGDGQQEPG